MGVAFVLCFFLMEETNYDHQAPQTNLSAGSSTDGVNGADTITEDGFKGRQTSKSAEPAVIEICQIAYPRKTYLQKLSVIGKKQPNRILEIVWPPFKFSFPVVMRANLCTSGPVLLGILCATESPLYTKTYDLTAPTFDSPIFELPWAWPLGE